MVIYLIDKPDFNKTENITGNIKEKKSYELSIRP